MACAGNFARDGSAHFTLIINLGVGGGGGEHYPSEANGHRDCPDNHRAMSWFGLLAGMEMGEEDWVCNRWYF